MLTFEWDPQKAKKTDYVDRKQAEIVKNVALIPMPLRFSEPFGNEPARSRTCCKQRRKTC